MTPDSKYRRAVVVGVVFVFIAIFIGAKINNTNSRIDTADEGTSANYSSQANIANGKELLRNMGGVVMYDALSEDLHTFAQTAYKPYHENTGRVVGFQVGSKIEKKGKIISLNGKFGAVSNKISITITLIGNQRFKLSITDTSTGLNIDQYLAANSVQNQFVGTLPTSGDDYEIDYDSASNRFIITLFPEESSAISSAYTSAATKLKSGLGVSTLDGIKVSVIRGGNSLAP